MGLVGLSFELALRATRSIVSLIVMGLVGVVRLVLVWARLMAGRPGEDELMVYRRRKWIMGTFTALPLAALTLFAPGLVVHTIGWIPMATSLPVLGVCIVMARRVTRRSGGPPPAPMPVQVPAVVGDYQPTARSVELERALGDWLWHLIASGLPVAHAVNAAMSMPHRSRLWLLSTAESSLAALGRLELADGHGLNVANADAVVWLWPFCESLRGSLALPSTAVVEPSGRSLAGE